MRGLILLGFWYYYVTGTSTGEQSGLKNSYRGACYHHNMKLTIKVCCDQSSKYLKCACILICGDCNEIQVKLIHFKMLPKISLSDHRHIFIGK